MAVTTTGRTGSAPEGGGGGRLLAVTTGGGGVASSYFISLFSDTPFQIHPPSSGSEVLPSALLSSHVAERASSIRCSRYR